MGERWKQASSEPYSQGMVEGNPFQYKADVHGTLVAVLRLTFHDRGLALEQFHTRAVEAGSVHELVLTDESSAAPGQVVRRAAYLGFVQLQGGVIGVGDILIIGKRTLGTVVGFDATHAPNHYNVVVCGQHLVNGGELGLNVGDPVVFRFNDPGTKPSGL